MIHYIKEHIMPFVFAVATAAIFLLLFLKFDTLMTNNGHLNINKLKKEVEKQEDIYVGDFYYNVLDVKQPDKIVLKNDVIVSKDESKRIVIVNLYIRNTSNKTMAIGDKMFALYDAKSQKYFPEVDYDLRDAKDDQPFSLYKPSKGKNVNLIYTIPIDIELNALHIDYNQEYREKNVTLLSSLFSKKKDEKRDKYISLEPYHNKEGSEGKQ